MVVDPKLPASRPAGLAPAIHLLAKPTGPKCNLKCSYCFFLGKEDLYSEDRLRMSDEVLEQYVAQVIEAQDGPAVTIAWQGGEPTLMGLDFFKKAIDLEIKYNSGRLRVERVIQTNGTLLDDRWCEFLAENDFLVGISIDGPPELHDAYRTDRRDRPTYERVIRGLELLKKHGAEFNILCCVHRANSSKPLDVYHHFKNDLDARFIQFIPIVEQVGDGVSRETVAPDDWGEFLCEVFDSWVRNDVGKVFVQTFDAALASWVGVPPGVCIFNETCGNGLVMMHNGDIYSCDHFVDDHHYLGNLTETHLLELAAFPAQIEFGIGKRDNLPTPCIECDVRFACQGECPKNRFVELPDNQGKLNYLCEGYKRFFNHIDEPMCVMAELLGAGKPPSLVMKIISDADARVGELFKQARRNDPCPCGSGRKFKRCHGTRDHRYARAGG